MRRKRSARIDPPSFDGGKKTKGERRQVLVDTQGLLTKAAVYAACVEDRDGGVMLVGSLFGTCPFLLKPYADVGYRHLSSSRAWPGSIARSTSRSFGAATQASWSYCPTAGSWGGASPGCTGAAGW